MQEITEAQALPLIIRKSVKTVEVFPTSSSISITIIRYNGGVVWMKFNGEDGKFRNQWYVPIDSDVPSISSSPRRSVAATPKRPTNVMDTPVFNEDEEVAKYQEEFEATTNQPVERQTTVRPNTRVIPPVNEELKPVEYWKLSDGLLDLNSPEVHRAFQWVPMEELQLGLLRKEYLERAKAEIAAEGAVPVAQPTPVAKPTRKRASK